MRTLVRSVKDLELEEVKPFVAIDRGDGFYKDTIHIIGFGFDGTTSFRPGARLGPDAIRQASYGLEVYSPYLDRETTARSIVDLGNLPFYPSRWDMMTSDFVKATEGLDLKADNIQILTLGGEHSISYAPIKLYLDQYKDLVLVHLDAHTDLRDEFLGDKNSHACIIRRVVDHFGPGHQLLQYGIRSGAKEEFEWMKKNKTVRHSLNDLCQSLEDLPNDRPIYLTLDLDFFDPAYMPGTGTPETGGEDFHGFMKILKILARKNFIGADINELAPMLDPSNNSACMASKVVREVLLSLNAKD